MSAATAYEGPECPRCEATLPVASLRSGVITCPACQRPFEATAFQPPQRRPQITTIVGATGPEGANACATHARNAAVTSCQRCGLFICSLCDMNVGLGSYCPSCFDRLRNEGALPAVATKYRDFASMARLTAIVGILFWFAWPLVGALAVYYAGKGRKQRRDEGRSSVGMFVVASIGLLEILGGLAMYGFFVWALFQGAK
ncbi:MAG TPA: hypothetical protein VFT12_08095 [Thermoanaerobaculia bacterium]|nr:hypothetical protein [Thermoanaerobaculia bacterium]